MTIHSSIFVWRIPWTEELGGLQSRGSQRIRHNGRDLAHMFIQLNMSIFYPCFFSGFICLIPLQQLYLSQYTFFTTLFLVIYFWLCWLFVAAAWAFTLVVALSRCGVWASRCRAQALGPVGLQELLCVVA